MHISTTEIKSVYKHILVELDYFKKKLCMAFIHLIHEKNCILNCRRLDFMVMWEQIIQEIIQSYMKNFG